MSTETDAKNFYFDENKYISEYTAYLNQIGHAGGNWTTSTVRLRMSQYGSIYSHWISFGMIMCGLISASDKFDELRYMQQKAKECNGGKSYEYGIASGINQPFYFNTVLLVNYYTMLQYSMYKHLLDWGRHEKIEYRPVLPPGYTYTVAPYS